MATPTAAMCEGGFGVVEVWINQLRGVAKPRVRGGKIQPP